MPEPLASWLTRAREEGNEYVTGHVLANWWGCTMLEVEARTKELGVEPTPRGDVYPISALLEALARA